LAGHKALILVGYKSQKHIGVEAMDCKRYRSLWWRFWMKLAVYFSAYTGPIRGIRWVSRCFPYIASPRKFVFWLMGWEYFGYPSSSHLFDHFPQVPEILHLHNLHGNYFDLSALPRLSNTLPTVITLHDTWLLAGHCAYFIDCSNWMSGCETCSHLDYSPKLHRDGAARNWQRKLQIYNECNLFLVCPSQWLADQVLQSMLMKAVKQLLVIHNGVDLSIFKPDETLSARTSLGWPKDAFIVMFAANCIHSIWKDYATMHEAILLVGRTIHDRPIHFYAIGEPAPPEYAGTVSIEFIPHQNSLVEYYQAADVFIHAAKADTFPTTILEALACGKPVVATAVGGIPEQIIEGVTGFLVPPGDAQAFADRLIRFINSPELVRTMGIAARLDAKKRFSKERMVLQYMQLYEKIKITDHVSDS